MLNQYLNDVLANGFHRSSLECRDDHHHPLITDVITAGHSGRSTGHREFLSAIEEWIRGCRDLSQSPAVKQLLAAVGAREHKEESTRLAQGRLRASSSCTSEQDAITSRVHSLSFSREEEGKQQVSREGTLDRIINKTANMDLSTSELAHEKSIWLAKEMRGVRKKLNQISKLRESEAKSIVLTSDEQAKLDRRPLLEAELHIYQTAFEEVEKRIRELVLQDQSSLEVVTPPVAKCKNDELAIKKVEDPDYGNSLESTYFCDVCGIKCPDKTSFELHQNGRKHRNRVAQVEEEEKELAARTIIAQKMREQLKVPATIPTFVKTTPKNAWGVPSTPQPKFKLPPPPHPVVSQVVTPVPARSMLPSLTPNVLPSPTPVAVPSLVRAKGKTPLAKSLFPTATSPVCAKNTRSPVVNNAPFHLHPSPVLTIPHAPAGQRKSYALADFIAPHPHSTPTTKTAQPTAAWTSPVAATSVDQYVVKPKKSLAEIQAEEVDFKAREDRAFKSDGKESSWFIERRERADSLHAIQQAAEIERETELLIQEQLEIEAQIQREIAAQRAKEGQQSKKVVPKEDRPKKNRRNGTTRGGTTERTNQETAKPTSKSRKNQSSKRTGIKKAEESNKSCSVPILQNESS